MMSFRQYISEMNGYTRYDLYHGHNDRDIKEGEPYPHKKKFIYATENGDEALTYGRHVHSIAVKSGLKTAHLYSFPPDKTALNDVQDKFGKDTVDMIKRGKLWRNKPHESEVFDHLHSLGYQHIIFTDEDAEDNGDETTSHLIYRPHENVHVGDKR